MNQGVAEDVKRKKNRCSTLASKTAKDALFDQSGKNTYAKLSALFIVVAILSHHLPLCIIVHSTFFIYC